MDITLLEGLRRVAQGDFQLLPIPEPGSESAILVATFNYMVSNLSERYWQSQNTENTSQTAIEASRDAIWISNADRHVVMVNSALERMTGIHRSELLGQTCRYLFGVHTLDGASICDTGCPFLKLEDGNEQDTGHIADCGGIEGTMPTGDGAKAYIEISYGRVRDPHENLLSGVVHIVHDLTQRRELEQLKDEFIAMVSHELRTPLHHIKGFSTSLLQTDVEWDLSTQQDFLESISRETDRLSALVEKILHLSRLEAGGLPLDKEWIRADALVQHILTRLQAFDDFKRIQFELADNLPPFHADHNEIETALTNLVENALKYAPDTTSIQIDVQQAGSELVFSVSDHGPGIPPADQARIFDRFYRVKGNSQQPHGSGLGLAICKRIIESHGGRIWLDSGEPGNTRFCFALPLGK